MAEYVGLIGLCGAILLAKAWREKQRDNARDAGLLSVLGGGSFVAAWAVSLL